MRIVEAITRAAVEGGWVIERDRQPDDDGNLCISLERGGHERVTVTVFFDRIRRQRPTGELVYARDEHSALAGRAALLERLRAPGCVLCRI